MRSHPLSPPYLTSSPALFFPPPLPRLLFPDVPLLLSLLPSSSPSSLPPLSPFSRLSLLTGQQDLLADLLSKMFDDNCKPPSPDPLYTPEDFDLISLAKEYSKALTAHGL